MSTKDKNKNSIPGENPSQEHPLEQSLAFQFKSLARDFDKLLERRLLSHNISLGMWAPLRLLWQEDGQFQHELQKKIGIAQPSLVSALQKLEMRGFIHRQHHPSDRRQLNIYLTEEGKNLEAEILPYANEIQQLITKNVTRDELSFLQETLQRIQFLLQEELTSHK